MGDAEQAFRFECLAVGGIANHGLVFYGSVLSGSIVSGDRVSFEAGVGTIQARVKFIGRSRELVERASEAESVGLCLDDFNRSDVNSYMDSATEVAAGLNSADVREGGVPLPTDWIKEAWKVNFPITLSRA